MSLLEPRDFFSNISEAIMRSKYKLKPIRYNRDKRSKNLEWNKNYESKINKKTYFPFKNKHQGEECVILGTGNTLDDYIPMKDLIHLSMNSIVLYEKLIVDYYFVMDKRGPTTFNNNENEIINYKPKIQKIFLENFKQLKKKVFPKCARMPNILN